MSLKFYNEFDAIGLRPQLFVYGGLMYRSAASTGKDQNLVRNGRGDRYANVVA